MKIEMTSSSFEPFLNGSSVADLEGGVLRVGLSLALGWGSGRPLGGQARTICEAGRPHCTHLVSHVRVWARWVAAHCPHPAERPALKKARVFALAASSGTEDRRAAEPGNPKT